MSCARSRALVGARIVSLAILGVLGVLLLGNAGCDSGSVDSVGGAAGAGGSAEGGSGGVDGEHLNPCLKGLAGPDIYEYCADSAMACVDGQCRPRESLPGEGEDCLVQFNGGSREELCAPGLSCTDGRCETAGS
jgi:hypothetical protein